MAFNRQTFRTRTLTAAVFAALMLTGLLWNQWSFLVLFSVIHFGCWWEYFNLLEKIHATTYHRYTKIGFMLMGYALMLQFCGPAYEIAGYGLKNSFSFPVSVAGMVLLASGILQSQNFNLKAFGAAATGLLYISLCWGLMMDLYRQTPVHIQDTMLVLASGILPFQIVLSIWINDTMAYIVGSLIGKTSLSPVSPKKTWEGTIGGILLSVMAMALLYPLIVFKEVDVFFVFVSGVIAGIASIAGTVGDLVESKLKRMAGVKDSGTLMPGHGGFLDRFDSMLFAVPAVWMYVYFILK
jgi:phosphatidate cytidylyltransferase